MFNINEFDNLYRRKIRGLGVTGALVRVSLKRLSAKKLRVLTHVAVENLSNPFTKVRLGISNRGEDYYLDELQTVAANELCVKRSDILLMDGDCFFSEFTGTTDGDVLVMVVNGWEKGL